MFIALLNLALSASIFQEARVNISVPAGISYKYGFLSNGIRVLMIKDEKLKIDSCSLSVGSGSSCDPIKYPGIAHLFEHIALCNREDGPRFKKREFLEWKGLEIDCSTGVCDTCYSFSIPSNKSEDAFEMLASVIENPVFDQKTVDSAKKIVDLEYFESGGKRIKGNFAYDVVNTGSNSHNTFVCGNSQIFDQPDTLKHVMNFYKSNYVAENICIVVISPRDFESQIKTMKNFDQIPRDKNFLKKRKTLFSSEKKGWILKTDNYGIDMLFLLEIPRNFSYSGVNPETAVFEIFKGVFEDLIRASGNATKCEFEIKGYERSVMIAISITCTPLGLQNYKEVINFFSAFLNQIEITPKFYKELAILLNEPLQMPKSDVIAENLQRFPVSQAIVGDSILMKYDKIVIMNFLKDLRNPQNWVIFVRDDNILSKNPMKSELGEYLFVVDKKISPEFYPLENFLDKIIQRKSKTQPRSLELIAKRDCDLSDGILHKKLKLENGTINFIFDDKFFQGTARIKIFLKSEEFEKNILNFGMLFYIQSIGFYIKSNIDFKTKDIILSLEGSAETMVNEVLEYFDLIIKRLESKVPLKIDSSICDQFSQNQKRSEDNFYTSVIYLKDHINLLKNLQTYDFSAMNSFEEWKTEIVVVGDLELSDIQRLEKLFCKKKFTKIDDAEINDEEINQAEIKLRETWWRIQNDPKGLKKTIVVFSLGRGLKKRIIAELLKRFLSPVIFRIIRSESLLSYFAHAFSFFEDGVSHFYFKAVMDLDEPAAVAKMTDVVVESFRVLSLFSEEDFRSYFVSQEVLNTTIKDKDSLWQYANLIFETNDFCTDIKDKEKKILEEMKPNDLIEVLQTLNPQWIFEQ